MTVTTPGAMLPTIRSRCRALPLHPLEPQMLETLMARYDIDCGTGAEKARLLALAGGSLGFAQKIIETGALAILDEIAALFAGDMDVARCHRLAEKFAKKADADSFFVLSDILREILRQQILAGTRSTEAPQDLPSFYKGLPLDRLLQLWDKLGAIFHRTDVGNLDRKLAFINAMIEIRRASA
jgi:DNA polymerase-3 subunit delta'